MNKFKSKDADIGSLNLEMSLIIGLVVLAVVASLTGVGGKIADLYEHQAVVIEEGPVGNVRILISDPAGDPIPNVNIAFNPVGQAGVSRFIDIALANRVITGKTNEEGIAFFKYVPVGKATITVEGDEVITTTSNVTVLENKLVELPVEVRLAKFSLQYDRNGGTGTVPPASEGKILIAATPTGLTAPQYQEFAGWGSEPSGGTVFSPGESINIPQVFGTDNENIVLFAQWRDRSDVYQNFEMTIVPGYGRGSSYNRQFNTVRHWNGWYAKFDFRANSTTNPNQRYTFTYYNNVGVEYWDPQYENEYRDSYSFQTIEITGSNGFSQKITLPWSDFKQHVIKLVAVDNNFKVYLDGVLRMNVTDSQTSVASRPVKGYIRQLLPDPALPSGFSVDSVNIVKIQ